MQNFVKPGSVVRDRRSEDEKDRALVEKTARDLHHIQRQLVAGGHSLQDVICQAAKNAFGITVSPHAPEPREDVEAA